LKALLNILNSEQYRNAFQLLPGSWFPSISSLLKWWDNMVARSDHSIQFKEKSHFGVMEMAENAHLDVVQPLLEGIT
jgi:hypothetical protein